ncbi:MAG: winged helix-turn-helix domain-containing protein [Anaerolineae bacterium]|nr:winged helix-turn-helix domain-containing protein [Anaerolineae bacterium]
MKSEILSREPVFAGGEFVGREEEINWISSILGRQTPENCNIIGEPRIGKTSFLYHIYRQKVGLPPLKAGLYVWIRLTELRELNSLTFWRYILERLCEEEKLGPLGQYREIKPRDKAHEVFFDLDEEIKRLWKEVGYERIIFLIDDAELVLMSEGINSEDHDWLRSLVTYYKECLAFVMSSTNPLHLLHKERFKDSVSPLMNIFHSRSLSLLAQDGAVKLIQAIAKAENTQFLNEDIKFLLSEAGRHPDLLKIACEYLIEAKVESDSRISEEIYDDVRSDMRYDGHVRGLCQRLIERRTDQERKVLKLMAEGKNEFDDRILLRRLKKHLGLVEERDGELALFSDAFNYWMSHGDKQSEVGEPLQSSETILEYLPEKRQVRVRNELVSLTSLENRLLNYLTDNIGRVCTLDELLENVWGRGKSKSVVEKAINRLRAKVEVDVQRPRYILSVRGEGYILQSLTIV